MVKYLLCFILGVSLFYLFSLHRVNYLCRYAALSGVLKVRDLIGITTARIVVIIGQLLYVKMYSNYLSLHELGIYFFIITVSYAINALIFVPVDYYQQSKLYEFTNTRISLKSLVRFNGKLLFFLSFISVILVIISLFIYPQALTSLIFVIVMSVALHISQSLRGVLNNLEHRKVSAASLGLEAILKTVLFWATLRIFDHNAFSLILSWILTSIIVIIYLIRQSVHLGIFSSKDKTIVNIRYADVFRFGYPISVGALFNWFQLQGYRLILVPLGFTEMVGMYATIASIGSAGMGAASSIFSQMFVPNIYKSNGEYIKIYLRNASIIILFVLFFSIFFSDLIVKLVASDSFSKYSWLICFGIIAEAGNFLSGALAIHTTLTQTTTNRMMIASAIGAVSMIFLYSIIYYLGDLNIVTIGMPIAASQAFSVLYLYIYFKINSKSF